MALEEKINQDLIESLKQGDKDRALLLRGLKSSLHNKKIEKKAELKKEDVALVLQKERKQREDSIDQFKKGGREDLAKKEAKELELIKGYLPKDLSEEFIKKEAAAVIKEVGASGPSDTGKVMGALMPRLKGKTDGGKVSAIVAGLLKNSK